MKELSTWYHYGIKTRKIDSRQTDMSTFTLRNGVMVWTTTRIDCVTYEFTLPFVSISFIEDETGLPLHTGSPKAWSAFKKRPTFEMDELISSTLSSTTPFGYAHWFGVIGNVDTVMTVCIEARHWDAYHAIEDASLGTIDMEKKMITIRSVMAITG